jgi:hypothetical protein
MISDPAVQERLVAQNRAMRALNDADRAASIAAASNVIGFERFTIRARQVQVRDSYRRFRPGGEG